MGEQALDTFQIGAVILDKYEITGELGKGGMGVVLAAHHRELDRLVALKFLHPSLRDKPGIAARFAQESRTASRIQSEHVVRIHDVAAVDGVPFIVMERLTGQDLSAKIREHGQLDIDESADLLLQACEAINEAHSLGIVHRDLKPANLFITAARDGTPLVKVLDFGISKSTATSDMSVTADTAVLGSPLYMSPEQYMSAKSVDARSDIWALGVILYEMLTGAPPFTGDDFQAVRAAILDGDYKKPSDPRPNIPRALEQTIADALTVDREARLPRVDAFAERLAPFATGLGLVSYDRIRRLASRSQAPSERPVVPAPSETPPRLAGRGDQTATGSGTTTTDGLVARAEPRPSRWRGVTALGAVVALAGLAVAVPRMRQARLASSEPTPSASEDPAPMNPVGSATAASAPSSADEAKAARVEPDGMNPVASAIPAPSASPPHVDETRSAPGSASVGTTTGEHSPRAAVAPPGGGAGCASGATATCEAACAANEPGSCLKLAQALDKGLGAPRNAARAASLYQTTCDGGSLVACNDLGASYSMGDGVARDAAKAVALFTRACNGGNAKSCVNLGAMHFDGNGVPKNESLGASFFLKGCEAGEAPGCLDVSIAYGAGRGVPKDPAQSFTFAERACTGGARVGCVRVELAKIAGDGVAKDVKGALAQLDGLCSRREPAACESLAQTYARGVGTDVPADPVRVRAYWKKACDFGSKQGCQAVQTLGKEDSLNSSAGQANAMFQTRCDAGDLGSCASLGENLLTGNATSVDRAKGTALLERACRGGIASACKRLEEERAR
jgi:serine/threonine protein kinase/TPR repeat protein